ncbi:MAG: single-stranded DNA-binding protein [Candidatus Gracilibacteria bacterium]
MRSVNKVILIGNLTRDPVLKQTENGQPVCTFGIATNREWTTRDGDRKSLAEFHNVVAWSGLAEKCFKYLKKGKLVYVEGYLKTRVFQNDDGTKSFRTEIVIYDMIMLDKRMAGEGDMIEESYNEAMNEAMAHDEHHSMNHDISSIERSIDTL